MPHITAHFIILFFKKLDLRDTHTNFPNKNHYPKEKIPAMLMGNKTKQFYCFFQGKKETGKRSLHPVHYTLNVNILLPLSTLKIGLADELILKLKGKLRWSI